MLHFLRKKQFIHCDFEEGTENSIRSASSTRPAFCSSVLSCCVEGSDEMWGTTQKIDTLRYLSQRYCFFVVKAQHLNLQKGESTKSAIFSKAKEAYSCHVWTDHCSQKMITFQSRFNVGAIAWRFGRLIKKTWMFALHNLQGGVSVIRWSIVIIQNWRKRKSESVSGGGQVGGADDVLGCAIWGDTLPPIRKGTRWRCVVKPTCKSLRLQSLPLKLVALRLF